jgi:hypothetical protein
LLAAAAFFSRADEQLDFSKPQPSFRSDLEDFFGRLLKKKKFHFLNFFFQMR